MSQSTSRDGTADPAAVPDCDHPIALHFDHPVALIGGGEAAPEDIADAAARSGAIIAADGGANHFTPGGVPRLDAVIGDMDSIDNLDAWRAAPDCQVLALGEQDTTDFEKCLYSSHAPLYLAVGFFGARVDHTLAALNVLAKHENKRVLMIGRDEVCFLTPLSWRARLWPGARVSIFPLPSVTALGSTGLRWPIDDLHFEIGGAVGTSNEAVSAEVSARFAARRAAIFFDRSALDAAIEALVAAS